jgi:HEAT repeat protein
MRSRSKFLAFSTVALGLVVLAVATIAAKDRLREEYYIRKLLSAEESERIEASKMLGVIGNQRGLKPLLESVVRCASFLRDGPAQEILEGGLYEQAGFSETIAGRDSIVHISQASPKRALPVLTAALDHPDWLHRCMASFLLGEVGVIAKPTNPQLERLLQDEVEDVRQAASEALKKIQGDAR